MAGPTSIVLINTFRQTVRLLIIWSFLHKKLNTTEYFANPIEMEKKNLDTCTYWERLMKQKPHLWLILCHRFLFFVFFCCCCVKLWFTHSCALFHFKNVWVLSRFSHVWPSATLWTVARQARLSMGFSRQEYWSGLPPPSPCPSRPRDWTHLLCLLHWQVGSLSLGPPGKPNL